MREEVVIARRSTPLHRGPRMSWGRVTPCESRPRGAPGGYATTTSLRAGAVRLAYTGLHGRSKTEHTSRHKSPPLRLWRSGGRQFRTLVK